MKYVFTSYRDKSIRLKISGRSIFYDNVTKAYTGNISPNIIVVFLNNRDKSRAYEH